MSPDGGAVSRASFSVLLVCRANVCRSPSAEVLLRRCIAESSLSGIIDVASAGVSVVPGLPWCRAAAAQVGDGPDRTALLTSHRARSVDTAMVGSADIVLTAARDQRAAVVRLVPSARVRVFTLKEAAVLAEAVAARMGQRLEPSAGAAGTFGEGSPLPGFALSDVPLEASPRERLGWLTAEMHNARGLVPLPGSPSEDRYGVAPWWRRRRRQSPTGTDGHGIDIPDPHGPQPAPHSADAILSAVRSWAAAAQLTLEAATHPRG